MKKTHLYNSHIELNAKMVDFAGWSMPIQYNNLKEEVLAVRENIGVFDVSHMGEFFIEGTDATKFVNFMVTNDIEKAEDLKAIYSPMCKKNGTILDDLIIYKISEKKIMICVNASNIDKDFNWFEQNTQNFDVKLSNRSNDYSLLAVQGPNSYKVLKEVSQTNNISDIDYYSLQVSDEGTNPTIYARTGYTGEDGFEIFASHEFIKSLWTELMNKKVKACGLGARDVLRLEVCYPLYGNELNERVTPLESALKWTVKMDKDDFLGKESLKEHKPTTQLIKLILDKGIPRENYEVFNEKNELVGKVTSGTMSVVLKKGIALARVEKEIFKNSTEFYIEIRNKKYEAKYTKKSFITGGHK